MSDFSFLSEYVIDSKSKQIAHSEVKHSLYKLEKSDIDKIEGSIEIPYELNEFWIQVGYGFFHNELDDSFDRILDPESYKDINLNDLDNPNSNYYNPEIDYYIESFPNRVLFLEIDADTFLTMDKKGKNNKNAIYYFDELIADSLEIFLKKFDKEKHYFEKS